MGSTSAASGPAAAAAARVQKRPPAPFVGVLDAQGKIMCTPDSDSLTMLACAVPRESALDSCAIPSIHSSIDHGCKMKPVKRFLEADAIGALASA